MIFQCIITILIWKLIVKVNKYMNLHDIRAFIKKEIGLDIPASRLPIRYEYPLIYNI